MDLRTGKVYESEEAARRAGVPEADLLPVSKYDNTYWPRIVSSPHQSEHEMARRVRQLAAKAAKL